MPDAPTDDWRDDAACRGAPHPDLWFSHDPIAQERAKATCARCKVRTTCLAYALRHHETNGIWGGRTQLELRDIRRALRDRQRGA